MMKRPLFFTILMLTAIVSFAADIPNMYIFIEGTADIKEHYQFFLTNFQKEAGAEGYIVTEKRNQAAHTVFFSVSANIGVLDYRGEPVAQSDGNKYIVRISLIRNFDNFEVLYFDFFFTTIDEVYEYTRTLFQNATLYIPPFTEEDFIKQNNLWRNKLIYFRASFDYPITFYRLLPEGLHGGIALYGGSKENDSFRTSPIDNEVWAMPGVTLGIEFKLFKYLNFEINYQLDMGDTRDNTFVNMAAGAEIKFPIYFKNIMLVPYGAFSFPFTISDIFIDFPPLALGGGLQICVKGGKRGAFFADIKYLLTLTDTVMKNPYLSYPEKNQQYPEPSEIHYNRSALRIGLGYKIGIIDR